MQTVVETLNALSGVNHVAVYQNGELQEGNFPESQFTAIHLSSGIISQIFFALESVQMTHNELYFAVDSGYLAAFRLDQDYIALLLMDRKINFPMISMGVKSASEIVKHQQALTQAELTRQQLAAAQINAVNTAPVIDTNDLLLPVFNQYTRLLTQFLGPAAPVVMEEALDQWKQTYLQTTNNLPYLIAILEEELESNEERLAFNAMATRVTLPAM